MKSVELKKGWLFKIAKIGGLSWHDETYGVSICEYNQYILKGAFTIIFCSILVLFISWVMINPIVYGVAYIFEYADMLQLMQKYIEVVAIGGAIDAVMLIWCPIALYCNSHHYIHQQFVKVPKEPSAITLHWRAFKDKVCFTVNFKENT